MKQILLLTLTFFATLQFGFCQVGNNMCEGALPFCTGTSYSFPAGTGTPSAQSGPYYSCLSTTPNPAWYYMKIALPGMIQITMHSEPAHDIDFCLWGPFDTQNACGQLTASKVVDCSYSTAATEVVDIANAVQGKYYILIITNYSNQPCNIIFSQTGGQGKTDCTILPPAAGSDAPLCVGETLHLVAANMNNAVYHWTGPDGWSSFVQNPTRPNVTLAMAGTYSLFVTVNGQPSADTNTTAVAIYNKPTATLSGGGAICQYDSVQLSITCANHPPWNVTVTGNGSSPVSIPINTVPYTFWVHPLTNTTYAITNVNNEICNGTASGTAIVTVNQKPQANFNFDNDCSGYPTEFNDASLLFGGTISTWYWDFGVFGDTSNIQNPTYTYTNGASYSVLLRVTSNNGCKGQIIKPVLIHPTPVASAGLDKSIPYGTNTTLQGSASGGSGAYTYHWEPANLLVNPAILNPVTVNLSATTDFTLTVTDQGNGCIKSDIVTVTITGGPMGVQLSADPPAICRGTTTLINTQTGGGSGTYSYAWSSDPPGFTSTLEDITVQPEATTTYILEATDGFSTLNKSITITVYPDPTVSAGSPQSIPNGTSTTLVGFASSSATPLTFAWSPTEYLVTPNVSVTSTTLLSNSTNFTLLVTDGHGCKASSDIMVTITGGPLHVNPSALPHELCKGESTVLHPVSEGGSGHYTYSWSAGGVQLSTQPEITVTPATTTKYDLLVDDGYTQTTGYITITVNPLPVINLIPPGAHVLNTDTMLACVFDTLTISAYNPNQSYLWSNGAITPEITTLTTGMAFDMLSYQVEVENLANNCKNTGNITIIFSFGECSYGVPDGIGTAPISVFPNPSNGEFYCRFQIDQKEFLAEVLTLQGVLIKQETFPALPGSPQTVMIDLKDQPSGMYLLKLSNADFLKVFRIVKK